MTPFFQDLGRSVHTLWKAEDFSLAAFPGIAAKLMEKRPPSRHVSPADLIRGFLLEEDHPFQTLSGFGQPELILFDHPRFYIQALFWLDGTTDIHQHTFSGAFHVMAGSSLHTRFRFENRRPVTPRLHLGDLHPESTTLLPTGSTVPILSGAGCIHSLFHLETPSVTVVIRTHNDPGTDPQFTYLPPHVALDPLHQEALTLRRKQLLDVLEQTGDPSYADLLTRVIGEADLESAFFLLQNGIGHLTASGEWERLRKAFARRHPKAAAPVTATLGEIIRRDAITAMRSHIEDVEHRFFLALLMNVPDRRSILGMVKTRVKGDPAGTILRWASELLHETSDGLWILDACFPDEITRRGARRGADAPAIVMAALSHFLRGGPLPAPLRSLDARGRKECERILIASSLGKLGATR
jgi:hypothetical protein